MPTTLNDLNTKQDWKNFYDKQITLLLSKNFQAWIKLINESTDDCPRNHYHCWLETGHNPLSLFSCLPKCDFCATQVDNLVTRRHSRTQHEQKVIEKIHHLNDMEFSYVANDTEFSKEQLENIRDRQLHFWEERTERKQNA